MGYFIRINRLGNAFECNYNNCCRATFWNKDIAITENFYNELFVEKNVMLIPEIHKDSNLIPNLELFFERTVDFTVFDIEDMPNNKVLICMLNAYFKPDNEPF